MKTKSYRRQQIKRCLDSRKNNFIGSNSRKALKKHITTPKACSCWMCGNPRKYLNEITLQEQRSILNYQEGLL
ncbi:hypothetical protein [Gilliamella apis]|uniref:hypothetical protein n=1 Tax=Gilliamella apis TaxID=1970738 RepID=UPI0011B2546C|nr:hypothetical protein [Gilliamella apis]